jgi:hypothetical protein
LEAPSIAFKPSFESYEILLCSLSIVNLDGLSSKLKIGEKKKNSSAFSDSIETLYETKSLNQCAGIIISF